MSSFLTHLECDNCSNSVSADRLVGRCPACDGPLVARYDLASARKTISNVSDRPHDVWRFSEVMPVRNEKFRFSLGEGWTPLIHLDRTGSELDLPKLFFKDEGNNPTGSFKARGAAVAASRAKELGVNTVALASSGNAGAAWAAYGARASLEVVVAMLADAPEIMESQIHLNGAHLLKGEGFTYQVGAILAQAAKDNGWFNVSSLREPYRIEGKKTMGYEIAEQLGWSWPTAIVYPMGGGVGLVAIWKAVSELFELGLVRGAPPKIFAVQPTGCSPIVDAIRAGLNEPIMPTEPSSIAYGIRTPNPPAGVMALRAIRESGGGGITVDDDAMVRRMLDLGRHDGVLATPEGAAGVEAASQLRSSGIVGAQDSVVVLNTATALKRLELVPSIETPVVRSAEELSRVVRLASTRH